LVFITKSLENKLTSAYHVDYDKQINERIKACNPELAEFFGFTDHNALILEIDLDKS
jgi:hypothetical protein